MSEHTIFQKLIEAQAEFHNISQESEATITKGASYKYADISAILKKVRPILNRHGLAILQKTTADAHSVSVETILYDAGGECISSGPFTVSTEGLTQRGVQAFGSAVTYARRYSLVSFLAVAYGEKDDDGQSAVEAAEKSAAESRDASKRPPSTPQEFVLTQDMVDEAKAIAQQGPESYRAHFTSLPFEQQAAMRSSGWHRACYQIAQECATEVIDPPSES